jgi:hypothetical protein
MTEGLFGHIIDSVEIEWLAAWRHDGNIESDETSHLSGVEQIVALSKVGTPISGSVSGTIMVRSTLVRNARKITGKVE